MASVPVSKRPTTLDSFDDGDDDDESSSIFVKRVTFHKFFRNTEY